MSTEHQEKEVVYVAIDIEKSGPRLKDDILAIGVAVGSANDGKLDARTWCFPQIATYSCGTDTSRAVIEKFFEWNTWTEFWSKQLELLKNIEKASKIYENVEEAWKSFVSYWDSLEETYKGKRIVILSDNPAFDVGHVDYELSRRFDHPTLRYTKSGVYCCIEDPSERAAGSVYEEQIYEMATRIQDHNHWPTNDALHILAKRLAIDHILKGLHFIEGTRDDIFAFLERGDPLYLGESKKRKTGSVPEEPNRKNKNQNK